MALIVMLRLIYGRSAEHATGHVGKELHNCIQSSVDFIRDGE